MGISLYIILSTMLTLTIFILIKAYYNNITRMAGMMLAMTLGMGGGLIFGFVLGVIFAGNLFVSTVLGMGTGIVIGLFAGVPLSLIAVLDGMLSGLMGGMMGTMLGAMIPNEYQDAMIKILFYLFIAIFSLLLQMVEIDLIHQGEPPRNYPLLAIILFVLFFVIFHQFGPVFSEPNYPSHEHTAHER